MGENEQGETENFKVTWKPQKSNRFDKNVLKKKPRTSKTIYKTQAKVVY